MEIFISTLSNKGLDIDRALLRKKYDSLDPRIKQNARIILLPVAASSGVVYAMDNITGKPVIFNFSRSSFATLFDENYNLQRVEANIPRIDYGNYSKDGKLLLEKSSTNLIADSNNFLGTGWSRSGIQLTETEELAYGLEKYWLFTRLNNNVGTSLNYNTVRCAKDEVLTATAFIKNDTSNRIAYGFFNDQDNGWGNAYDSSNEVLDGEAIPTGGHGLRAFNSINGQIIAKVTRNVTSDVTTYRFLIYPDSYYTSSVANRSNLISSFQITNNEASSYIPTKGSEVTRSADLLKYTLEKDSKITIKTHLETIEIYRPAGEWNVQDDISYSAGIEYIIIEEMIDTDYTEDVVLQLFKQRVIRDGGIFEDIFSNNYKTLSADEKKSDIIIVPGAYKEGFVYGINKDSTFTKLPFNRSSSATMLDKDMNLQSVATDMPRIDYGNYSKNAKLLVEKNSTNHIPLDRINAFNSTVTPVSGEKYINARLFRESVTPDDVSHRIYYSFGMDIISATASFLLKYDGTRQYIVIRVLGYTNEMVIVDLLNKVIVKKTEINSTVYLDVLEEGWVRLVFIQNNPNNEALAFWIATSLTPDSNSSLPSFIGDPAQGFLFALPQTEFATLQYTSYIPTTKTAATRSADLISCTLQQDCSVYLKTTKQEVVLDKQAGQWNIHENLNNEGIITILINNK